MQIHSTKELAAAVQAWRKQCGISQKELAARADVSRRWLNEFEQGKATVELHLVFHLLRALGLVISLSSADSPPKPPAAPGSADDSGHDNGNGGDDAIDLNELLSGGHHTPRRS